MNEVGAKEENKQDKKNGEVVEIDIHIGVFFDGTNNNANTNEWTDWFKFTSVVEKKHAYNNTIMYSEGQKKGKGDKDTEENVVLRKNSNPAILSKLFFTKAKSSVYG